MDLYNEIEAVEAIKEICKDNKNFYPEKANSLWRNWKKQNYVPSWTEEERYQSLFDYLSTEYTSLKTDKFDPHYSPFVKRFHYWSNTKLQLLKRLDIDLIDLSILEHLDDQQKFMQRINEEKQSPGIETMAERFNLSIETVKNRSIKLQDQGYIKKIFFTSPKGSPQFYYDVSNLWIQVERLVADLNLTFEKTKRGALTDEEKINIAASTESVRKLAIKYDKSKTFIKLVKSGESPPKDETMAKLYTEIINRRKTAKEVRNNVVQFNPLKDASNE